MGRSEDHAFIALDTTIGVLGIEATDAGVRRVRLADGGARVVSGYGLAESHAAEAASQLAEYARGEREAFDLVLDWSAVVEADRRILEILCEVAPFGITVTYGELGRRAGIEDAREIGVVMARNPLPLVVPCHRVVASDGLGGYGGGVELKRRLLELEGVLPQRFDLDAL